MHLVALCVLSETFLILNTREWDKTSAAELTGSISKKYIFALKKDKISHICVILKHEFLLRLVSLTCSLESTAAILLSTNIRFSPDYCGGTQTNKQTAAAGRNLKVRDKFHHFLWRHHNRMSETVVWKPDVGISPIDCGPETSSPLTGSGTGDSKRALVFHHLSERRPKQKILNKRVVL